MKLFSWLRVLFDAGIYDSQNEEEKRRAIVTNLFGLTGTAITGALSISALLSNEVMLGAGLMGASLLFMFTVIMLNIGRTNKSLMFSATTLVFTLMVLIVYLVVTGGKSNTGPIWMLIVPPVAFFLNGLRNGLIMLCAFLLIVIVLFFIPELDIITADYTADFKKRIVYVFMTVTFLSAVYEHSRQQTFYQIQALKHKFEHLAEYDHLTQILNRRGLAKQITYELARTKRQGSNAAVVLMDIDRFKKLNDNYGHDAGDKALQDIAKLMNKIKRSQDFLARWGGEEFLLILPDTSKTDAKILAEKLRDSRFPQRPFLICQRQ